MRSLQAWLGVLLLIVLAAPRGIATAYDGHPKLVVVIVIDQFRGDLLERYQREFGEGGFKLFTDRGANFTECNYDYANTQTAPGHATLATGAYSDGHGILANEWWDAAKKRSVTSVEDDSVRLLGGDGAGSSPHNLMADTLGDELKLATQGRARVFTLALKDRAAILPGGFSANYAFWIDRSNGHWVSSSFYARELPPWVNEFNGAGRAEKYWDLDWKASDGHVLRSTKRDAGKTGSFYELVGATPFANDYELEFARELVLHEKLGTGPFTDLLVVSLSANDILGHKVGPDSPEAHAMALELDRQIGEFMGFLGHQLGLASIWGILSADHGVAPLPSIAAGLRLPGKNLDTAELQHRLNQELSSRYGHNEYVALLDWPNAFLNEAAFQAAQVKEAEAEHAVGEGLKQLGLRGYFTRSQLEKGEVPATDIGRRYLHSYSPYGGWFVLGYPPPFSVGSKSGTDHGTAYSYDTHVPMAFYGLAFQTGVYRTHCEPVDMAVTLASLLGINPPTGAIGRVLTEALAPRGPIRPSSSRDDSERPLPLPPGLARPGASPSLEPRP